MLSEIRFELNVKKVRIIPLTFFLFQDIENLIDEFFVVSDIKLHTQCYLLKIVKMLIYYLTFKKVDFYLKDQKEKEDFVRKIYRKVNCLPLAKKFF